MKKKNKLYLIAITLIVFSLICCCTSVERTSLFKTEDEWMRDNYPQQEDIEQWSEPLLCYSCF